MPSLKNMAPQDKTEHLTIATWNGGPLSEPLEMDIYVNRLTGKSVPLDLNGQAETMSDAELENYQNAADLCHLVAQWNLTGDGVIVPEHEIVPLTPDAVSSMDLRFRTTLTKLILGVVFPNQKASPGSRKR